MRSLNFRIALGRCFSVCVILAMATALANVAACARLPRKTAPHHVPSAVEADSGSHRLTPDQLQRELFQFVDRYREVVGQATDAGARQATRADVRVLFQATKTSYVSAAISVVTGPRPIDALRDLLVMVTLQRMVWESGAAGQIPLAVTEPVARVLRLLETEIYDLAVRVLPRDAIAKLRALIEKWRRDNPDQHYVAYVRFQNLGTSPAADEVNEIISSGGFLEPVEAVAREAHEARLLAERTLYLANRVPMLIEWEATLAYQRIAASPEATSVLDDLQNFRAALERLGHEINALPGKVADERRSLVADFAQLVVRERAETLRNIERLIRTEREAFFRGLSAGADTYGPVLEQLAVTAVAAREAVAGLERMTGSDGEQSDGGTLITRAHEIAEKLATAARVADDVVVRLNALFNTQFRGLASVDAMLASQVQRMFLYAAALVLLSGAVLYVVVRAFRRQAN